MRLILGLIVIVYFVGIGVVLAPTVSLRWSTGTASELFANLWLELPQALAWPAAAYHRMMDQQEPSKTS